MIWILTFQKYPLNVLSGDAADFYAPLKSIFIQGDFLHQEGTSNLILHGRDGTYNVHTVGLAILWLPFFALASGFSYLLQSPLNGDSIVYQVSVIIAATCALWFGILATYKLLQGLNFSEFTCKATCVCLIMATHLMYYTWAEPGLSHVYAFALIAWVLFISYKLAFDYTAHLIIYWFFVLAVLVLLRPFHILWAFTPFFWNTSPAYIRKLFFNRHALMGLLVFIIVVSIQALVWYLQTGSIFKDTYPADGFYFSNPQLFKFLFHPQAGWLLYIPFMGVCFWGWLALVFKDLKQFGIAFLFLLLSIYILASFWAYNYFDGWGVRIMVDYAPLMAIGGAKILDGLAFYFKKMMWRRLLLLPFITWNILFTYQAQAGIIPRTGMTISQFKYVFAKTQSKFANTLGGWHEPTPYLKNKAKALFADSLQPASNERLNFWEYTPAISHELRDASNRLVITFNIARTEPVCGNSNKALLCVVVKRPGVPSPVYYTQTFLNEIPNDSTFKFYQYSQSFCGAFNSGDCVSAYVWNFEHKRFVVTKFKIQIFSYAYDIS